MASVDLSCWGYRGNQGALPLPSQSSGWVAAASLAQACFKFQAPNTSVHHPPRISAPKNPTVTQYGPSPETCHYGVPILHQAGGPGTQGQYTVEGQAALACVQPSSDRLCHAGIQHRVTHVWKMHKGRRRGTAVHHNRETRGVSTP